MLTLQPWTDTRVESHPVFVEVNLDATHRKSMSLSLFTLPIIRQPVVQPVARVWPTSRMFDIPGVENATKETMIMKWKLNKPGIKVQKKSCLRRLLLCKHMTSFFMSQSTRLVSFEAHSLSAGYQSSLSALVLRSSLKVLNATAFPPTLVSHWGWSQWNWMVTQSYKWVCCADTRY